MIFFVLLRKGHFHNVVLTLSNVVHTNNEIHNVNSTLFDIVNSDAEMHNVVSTLSHVLTLYQPKDNVKTTLKCFLGVTIIMKKSDYYLNKHYPY